MIRIGIDQSGNHNKYYVIIEHNDGNGTFTALAGSIGAVKFQEYLYSNISENYISNNLNNKSYSDNVKKLKVDSYSMFDSKLRKGYQNIDYNAFSRIVNDNVLDRINEINNSLNDSRDLLKAEQMKAEKARQEAELNRINEEAQKQVKVSSIKSTKISLNF